MKLGKFAKELREWRGSRLQKEVSSLLDVNQRTYEGWENGRKPSQFTINALRRLMTDNPHPPNRQLVKL